MLSGNRKVPLRVRSVFKRVGLTPAIAEALRAKAATLKVSENELIRQALTKFLSVSDGEFIGFGRPNKPEPSPVGLELSQKIRDKKSKKGGEK